MDLTNFSKELMNERVGQEMRIATNIHYSRLVDTRCFEIDEEKVYSVLIDAIICELPTTSMSDLEVKLLAQCIRDGFNLENYHEDIGYQLDSLLYRYTKDMPFSFVRNDTDCQLLFGYYDTVIAPDTVIDFIHNMMNNKMFFQEFTAHMSLHNDRSEFSSYLKEAVSFYIEYTLKGKSKKIKEEIDEIMDPINALEYVGGKAFYLCWQMICERYSL